MTRSISFGLGGKNLKDRDFFGVSDPYVTISRPSSSGGYVKIRTSETKMNTLNPEWNDFMITEADLSENGYFDKELKLMFRVYDDDGKKGPDGKDQLIGVGHFSLKDLEAAHTLSSQSRGSAPTLALSDQKTRKPAGFLVVRSYREHGGAGAGAGGYGSAPPGGQHHQPYGGVSGGGGSYPSSGGYPGATSYPAQPQMGYPPVNNPQAGMGYPPSVGAGYHQPSHPGGSGYPPASGMPPTMGGLPPAQGGMPPMQGGYGGYPPGTGQYPDNSSMFPPSNLPPGPGAGGWRQ